MKIYKPTIIAFIAVKCNVQCNLKLDVMLLDENVQSNNYYNIVKQNIEFKFVKLEVYRLPVFIVTPLSRENIIPKFVCVFCYQ